MAEGHIGPERQRRNSREHPPDMRLVLVGKTGAGKSSSGNTILGRDAFSAAAAHSSVTRQCCKQTGEVFNKQVTIVDTPGFFDTSLPEHTVRREIAKCINMSAPGPHAILLVIRLGPFTSEEQDAIGMVESLFGEEAWKYTIILFTHGDKVSSDFRQLVDGAGLELQSVLRKAGNRYLLFNNVQANDRGQVLDLLEKVKEMVDAHGGQFYSNDTYEQVVKMLQLREAELKVFYEKKLEEEIKSVESKYKKKLSEAKQEHQEVERRLHCELQELKRYYNALESGVRHVIEQTVQTDSMEDISKFHEALKLKFIS